ncbi:MAG TPA: hypothetical protein VE195_03365, partial [Acidobacteriaceae bacterium]|nr:hypothetical protein [Acidobacteriaceae bacterium]
MIETGALLLSQGMLKLPGIAQSKSASKLSYSTEMPDMLIAYLQKELNDLAAKWDRKRAAITTAAELEARNTFVRQRLLQMLGAFPAKSPLVPLTVKT